MGMDGLDKPEMAYAFRTWALFDLAASSPRFGSYSSGAAPKGSMQLQRNSYPGAERAATWVPICRPRSQGQSCFVAYAVYVAIKMSRLRCGVTTYGKLPRRSACRVLQARI